MAKYGKLRLTFKDPDALTDQIEEHVRDSLSDLGLDGEEMGAIVSKRAEKVGEMVAGWFEYGEYIHVEIDLDAKPPTARLLTTKEANVR